jgi:ketosteroid isomerase-like protein
MSAEQNKEIVQRFFDASNSGDMETSIGLIADDITWSNIGTTVYSGTFRGKTELQEKLLGPLFSQLKQGIAMTVHRLIAEGDYVVAQMSGIAETLEGKSYNNSYVWIIRIRAGQIAEVNEYMDTQLINSVFN